MAKKPDKFQRHLKASKPEYEGNKLTLLYKVPYLVITDASVSITAVPVPEIPVSILVELRLLGPGVKNQYMQMNVLFTFDPEKREFINANLTPETNRLVRRAANWPYVLKLVERTIKRWANKAVS